MGKLLKNANLVQRTGKVAFYQVEGESIYRRMEGFTDGSNSKNPKEYSRQYIDEDFERTDIVGFAPSISYAFDRYKGNAVLDDIINITENEYIGEKMVRSILIVDMTTVASSTGTTWTANGKLRDWAVIPDTDGDTTDCMTYSGNFKARGELISCTVTSSDDWQTVDYINTNLAKSSYANVSVLANNQEIGNGGGSNVNVTATTTEDTAVIKATSVTNGASLMLWSTVGSTTLVPMGSGAGTLTSGSLSLAMGDNVYTLICNAGTNAVSYKITITRTQEETE